MVFLPIGSIKKRSLAVRATDARIIFFGAIATEARLVGSLENKWHLTAKW